MNGTRRKTEGGHPGGRPAGKYLAADVGHSVNLIGHFASKDLEALLQKTVGGVRTHQVSRV